MVICTKWYYETDSCVCYTDKKSKKKYNKHLAKHY